MEWSGKMKKVQKYKQRSTNHTYNTKDRVTRTLLKTWGELRCSGRVDSTFTTAEIKMDNRERNLYLL